MEFLNCLNNTVCLPENRIVSLSTIIQVQFKLRYEFEFTIYSLYKLVRKWPITKHLWFQRIIAMNATPDWFDCSMGFTAHRQNNCHTALRHNIGHTAH